MKLLILLSLLWWQFALIPSVPSPMSDKIPGGDVSKDSTPEECLVMATGVYPNPRNFSIVITFLIGSETSLRLGLYNILGRKVEERDIGRVDPGAHRIEFVHPGLSSGVYFVSFQTPSCKVIRKILYVR